MKRNMERSSGSSDEDKTSLKKPKKENAAKLKNAETEIGETANGRNSGRNAQVHGCKRNVKKDIDGSSGSICGIGLTHKLHSGGGIKYGTFASNCDATNRDTCTVFVSSLNSLYNIKLENNIDSSIRVGFPNSQRHKVGEKESRKNRSGIGHEIVPSRRTFLNEISNLVTFGNGANAEGSATTRKRLFCCPQSAYNYLTEDIDHCVKRPCSCLGVQHRNDRNDKNGYSVADRRKISGIIHSPWFYSRIEKIDSFHSYQNRLFNKRSELNYRTNSTYNCATNIDESGRERTNRNSGQEKYGYDAKCLDGRVQEINQHSLEHSLLDEAIIDTFIDYKPVDCGPSIKRRLFCCPQDALIYLLEDISNEWRGARCSCQKVKFRSGGNNWCGDRGRSIYTSENHSNEHDSCREQPPIISGARGCETVVRYPFNIRTENNREVSSNFHPLHLAYVHGVGNVENAVRDSEVEIIGEVFKMSDSKVETIPVCDSRKNDRKTGEFHFVGESTTSDDSHRARNYNDAREARKYDDNVEEVYLDEESGDGYNDDYEYLRQDSGYISAEDVGFRNDDS